MNTLKKYFLFSIPACRQGRLNTCQLKTNSGVSRLSFLVLLFSFFILHSTFCIATAEIRYVSTTGTSTPPYTTWETAADSIQKCIKICNAGDTIIVANGVYYENLVIDSMLTLIGSSMDSTVIDGRGLGDHTIIFNASGNIENFNIYGRGNGLSGAAIRNLQSIDFIKVKNCQISETSVGIVFVNSSISAENILMRNLVRGFDLASANPYNYKILDCILILGQQNSQGIRIGFASQADAFLTNNIIIFTGTDNQGSYGISVGAPRQVHIYNNLISGFVRNIYTDVPQDTVFIKNNVLAYQYSPSQGPASILSQSNLEVNNIVLFKNKNGISGNSLVRSNFNLFWENNIDLIGTAYGDSDRVADPMFINDAVPSSKGNYDYHLQAYSPAINTGDPDILDVDSSRSDIGLYGGPLGESYTYLDLAPRQPVNISAIQDTNQILIKWNRNSEADTAYYNVYRDTVANFIIDSTKLIGSPVDTFFIQYPPYESNQYVYKITSVDNQGNESLPSEEVVIKPVSVSEYPQIVNDYYLYQNYPNPFNPSTRIGYKLKERGYVKLMVYDIKGELVSVLVNKEQEAGYYEVEFSSQKSVVRSQLASGIYLYRIEVIGDGSIPVYSDMKKMILIK